MSEGTLRTTFSTHVFPSGVERSFVAIIVMLSFYGSINTDVLPRVLTSISSNVHILYVINSLFYYCYFLHIIALQGILPLACIYPYHTLTQLMCLFTLLTKCI